MGRTRDCVLKQYFKSILCIEEVQKSRPIILLRLLIVEISNVKHGDVMVKFRTTACPPKPMHVHNISLCKVHACILYGGRHHYTYSISLFHDVTNLAHFYLAWSSSYSTNWLLCLVLTLNPQLGNTMNLSGKQKRYAKHHVKFNNIIAKHYAKHLEKSQSQYLTISVQARPNIMLNPTTPSEYATM